METMRKSAPTVAPWWLGYLFLLPLRRLWDGAARLTAGRLAAGDTVLELGPAMGFHTLDLARMVGPTGRVIACDVQEKMLAVLNVGWPGRMTRPSMICGGKWISPCCTMSSTRREIRPAFWARWPAACGREAWPCSANPRGM